jgi:hypothetical protein
VTLLSAGRTGIIGWTETDYLLVFKGGGVDLIEFEELVELFIERTKGIIFGLRVWAYLKSIVEGCLG